MKILHCTDFHFEKSWFEWLIQRAPDFDAVVLSGDLLDMFSTTPMVDQASWILLWAKRYARCGTPLLVCTGNHDRAGEPLADLGIFPSGETVPEEDLGQLLMSENWTDLLEDTSGEVIQGDATLLQLPGVLLTVQGFGFSSRKGNHNTLSESEKILANGSFRWLVVRHVPPRCVDDDPFPAFSRTPDLILSGHLHEAPYRGTFLQNSGRLTRVNPGHPPKKIRIFPIMSSSTLPPTG